MSRTSSHNHWALRVSALRRTSRCRGNALALALGALVVAAAASLVIASHTLQLVDTGNLTSASLRAQTAADGGVAYARWALARDASFTEGVQDIGGATVSVRVASPTGGERDVGIRTVEIRTKQTDRGRETRTRLDVRLRLGDGLPAVIAWEEH